VENACQTSCSLIINSSRHRFEARLDSALAVTELSQTRLQGKGQSAFFEEAIESGVPTEIYICHAVDWDRFPDVATGRRKAESSGAG
jgi:hypothetical protein